MKSLVKLICLILLLQFLSLNLQAQPKLWGTQPYGGEPGAGLVYEIDLNGNQMSDIHAFGKYEGFNSRHEVLMADNNKLYGIAQGGFGQFGSLLYEYDPETGEYNIIHDFFDPDQWIGLSASAGYLMQASDGLLYGLIQNGGPNQEGQLFSYDPATGHFDYLANFDAMTTGSNPVGVLTEASDGKLYGVASEGGVCNYGTIFSYDIQSGVLSQEICFDWNEGADPVDGMVLASNGLLYGMTNAGGGSGDGVIYSFEPGTGIYTLLHEFNTAAHGGKPYGRLYEASDGDLYGMASTGGLNGDGILFKYDPDIDLFGLRISFDGADGASPYGSLVEYDGFLYGMTTEGGVNNEGMLFRYDKVANQTTKLADFYGDDYGDYPYGSLTLGQDGVLYGQTYSGGAYNYGVMFKYNTNTMSFIKCFDFGQSDEGSKNVSSLLLASDGWVYGTTWEGGQYNGGTIYRINPANREFQHLYDFDIYSYGGNPMTGLIQAEDGYLYGTTPNGGTVNAGILYRFDANNKIVTVLEDLITPSEGAHPAGPPVQASDGYLYGLTVEGGSIGDGALYRFNLSNGVYIKLADFQDAASGSNPTGSLVEATNGKLYALAEDGGQFGFGTLFEYDPVGGTFFVKVHFDDLNKGAAPVGTLIEYQDNKLYGVCAAGGAFGEGTLFVYDVTADICTKVHDFNSVVDGYSPIGSLMKASNGRIYGTTNKGGAYDYGVLYEYYPVNGDYDIIHEFTTFREMPWYSALLEVETDYAIGENNAELMKLNVYPNPVRDVLTIAHEQAKLSICIYNQSGQLILEQAEYMRADNSKLDLEFLEPGIYIVRIQGQNGNSETAKFVKTN